MCKIHSPTVENLVVLRDIFQVVCRHSFLSNLATRIRHSRVVINWVSRIKVQVKTIV